MNLKKAKEIVKEMVGQFGCVHLLGHSYEDCSDVDVEIHKANGCFLLKKSMMNGFIRADVPIEPFATVDYDEAYKKIETMFGVITYEGEEDDAAIDDTNVIVVLE